ncbi:tyrosine-type recombinase/integrase [Pelagicoccus sp. SDUM812003]|uniref:tyrosine-type recombinase/integrase n=1 Tax=Pelagicoccus sp. SDUM812003 TaxID=3041267 RepID=UPI00280EE124|nr:tyrosine-type recombinase/integrase [Pelagicoccus sp. SDUM812003]MDQ8202780.1 tyrosine-type recombinase/integrase [Pelagicoccus sp. SDUM812003]
MAESGTGFLEKWEYPKKSGIFIRPVIYSKVYKGKDTLYTSYQVEVPADVTGTVRKRKRCKDKAKAEDYAAKEHRGSRKNGEVYFNATESERLEFGICLPKLRKKGISLKEAVDFALVHLRPEGGDKTLKEVVDELNASRKKRFERGNLRKTSYDDFAWKSNRLADSFPDLPINRLTKENIVDWIEDVGGSPRTNKNFLTAVAQLLKYAVQSRYIVVSPVDYMTDEERKALCADNDDDKEPSILSISEAERLLNAAVEHPELNMLGSVVLGLFCGIRTSELKLLTWTSVRDDEPNPYVTIASSIAKKRRIRNVDIPKNALEWLSLCDRQHDRVAYSPINDDFHRRFRTLRIHAGFGKSVEGRWKSTWGNNAMRHSFGTYHFAKHGDSMETSRLMGHKGNDEVLFSNYRALAKREDGVRFFQIKPSPTQAKVVSFA